MQDYVGKTCPFCKSELKEGEAIIVCPSCGIPHHESCWAENGGCTTFGCMGQQTVPQDPAPTEVCMNCGTVLANGQAFCSKCGTPRAAVRKNVCSNCGTEMQPDEIYCHRCGNRAGLFVDPSVASGINRYNMGVQKSNSKKKRLPIIIGSVVGAVAVVVVLLIIFLMPKSVSTITLSKSSISIEKGDTYTLSYNVEPSNPSKYTVTWTSDDTDVATVEDGVVKAKGNGTCTIEVRTDNGVTDTCDVTVTLPKEEKKVVGTWDITYVLDLDDMNSMAFSSMGWKLCLYSDNTGKIDTGSDGGVDLVWHYSYTNDSGNQVYLTDDDRVFFIYTNEHSEIWLYLELNGNNWCLTCE